MKLPCRSIAVTAYLSRACRNRGADESCPNWERLGIALWRRHCARVSRWRSLCRSLCCSMWDQSVGNALTYCRRTSATTMHRADRNVVDRTHATFDTGARAERKRYAACRSVNPPRIVTLTGLTSRNPMLAATLRQTKECWQTNSLSLRLRQHCISGRMQTHCPA